MTPTPEQIREACGGLADWLARAPRSREQNLFGGILVKDLGLAADGKLTPGMFKATQHAFRGFKEASAVTSVQRTGG